MSSVGKQLATFVAVLAVLFAGGAIAGQLIDPDARGGDEMSGHAAEQSHDEDSKMTSAHGGDTTRPVRGLAAAENGLRVEVERPELRRGVEETVAFRIVGETARSCATST